MKRLDENGYVLVFTTLMFALLMFLVGFATDGGRAYLLRAELTRTVDAAAIAAAGRISQGLPAAMDAACDSARMNGMTNCANLNVSQVTVNDASGNPKASVKVTGTATAPTVFVRAGKFFGCGTNCDALNVQASAVAAGGGTVDLVVNLDNTGSMAGDKINNAKIGANALVDAMLPAGGSSTSLVGMVPFQGCYNNGGSGCVNQQEYSTGMIVSLTNNTANLHGGINQLTGPGGSGTNVCNGLKRARQKLFGPAARPNSIRYIILLTDSENNFRTGLPAGSVDGACTTVESDAGNVALGVKTNDLATQIKDPTSAADGQAIGQTVKIFVIMYGPNATGSVPADCGPITGSSPTNGAFTRNLSRCIASSAGDVYLAPNATDISAAFQQIISRLPVLLIN